MFPFRRQMFGTSSGKICALDGRGSEGSEVWYSLFITTNSVNRYHKILSSGLTDPVDLTRDNTRDRT